VCPVRGMFGAVSSNADFSATGAQVEAPQFHPDKAAIIQIDADPTHLGRRHPVVAVWEMTVENIP
jgi:thiamine pyrophosphate-dependent acetolactate synthase large subunit-like protein